jgi:hypothetical protein
MVIRKQDTVKTLLILCMLLAVGMAIVTPALAASGIAKVDTFLDKISTALKGAGLITFAIAIMWAGYKFLFAHADMAYCGRILAGGLLIGSAMEIAAFVLG